MNPQASQTQDAAVKDRRKLIVNFGSTLWIPRAETLVVTPAARMPQVDVFRNWAGVLESEVQSLQTKPKYLILSLENGQGRDFGMVEAVKAAKSIAYRAQLELVVVKMSKEMKDELSKRPDISNVRIADDKLDFADVILDIMKFSSLPPIPKKRSA